MKTNEEIANELQVTRQAVHSTLKRGVRKLYKKWKDKYNTSPYDTFFYITTGLNLTKQKNINTLFNYLPKEVQDEITEEARDKFKVWN